MPRAHSDASTPDTSARKTLIYILSPSYSGSTLLTSLLAQHPAIATIGELKATQMGDLETYACACGEPILQCPFWATLGQRLAERGVTFGLRDFGTHFRHPQRSVLDAVVRTRLRGPLFELVRRTALWTIPGGRRWVTDRITRNYAIMGAVLELLGGSHFLDSSKDPVRLHYLRQADAWDFRVIHLIRDGRGTALSYMTHEVPDMTTAALEWKRTHDECTRAREAFPQDKTLVLRYEDLCANPSRWLREIHLLCGLAQAEADVPRGDTQGGHSHPDALSRPQHILGNAMRLRGIGTITVDERWRRSLDPDALQTFDRHAGELNRRYGYV